MSAGLSPGLISLPDSTYTTRRQPDCGGRFSGRSSRADDRSAGSSPSAPMPELTMPLRARCASCAATAPGSTQRPTPRGGVGGELIRCGAAASPLIRCGASRVAAGSVTAPRGRTTSCRIGASRPRRRAPPCVPRAPACGPGLRRDGRTGGVRPDDVRAGRPGLRHAGSSGPVVRRRHDLQPGHRAWRAGARDRRQVRGASTTPGGGSDAPPRPRSTALARSARRIRRGTPDRARPASRSAPRRDLLLWPARCSPRNPTVVASSRSVDGLDGGRWSRTARHTALPVRARRTSGGRRRPC